LLTPPLANLPINEATAINSVRSIVIFVALVVGVRILSPKGLRILSPNLAQPSLIPTLLHRIAVASAAGRRQDSGGCGPKRLPERMECDNVGNHLKRIGMRPQKGTF
jgi:hypothetical protein